MGKCLDVFFLASAISFSFGEAAFSLDRTPSIGQIAEDIRAANKQLFHASSRDEINKAYKQRKAALEALKLAVKEHNEKSSHKADADRIFKNLTNGNETPLERVAADAAAAADRQYGFAEEALKRKEEKLAESLEKTAKGLDLLASAALTGEPLSDSILNERSIFKARKEKPGSPPTFLEAPLKYHDRYFKRDAHITNEKTPQGEVVAINSADLKNTGTVFPPVAQTPIAPPKASQSEGNHASSTPPASTPPRQEAPRREVAQPQAPVTPAAQPSAEEALKLAKEELKKAEENAAIVLSEIEAAQIKPAGGFLNVMASMISGDSESEGALLKMAAPREYDLLDKSTKASEQKPEDLEAANATLNQLTPKAKEKIVEKMSAIAESTSMQAAVLSKAVAKLGEDAPKKPKTNKVDSEAEELLEQSKKAPILMEALADMRNAPIEKMNWYLEHGNENEKAAARLVLHEMNHGERWGNFPNRPGTSAHAQVENFRDDIKRGKALAQVHIARNAVNEATPPHALSRPSIKGTGYNNFFLPRPGAKPFNGTNVYVDFVEYQPITSIKFGEGVWRDTGLTGKKQVAKYYIEDPERKGTLKVIDYQELVRRYQERALTQGQTNS